MPSQIFRKVAFALTFAFALCVTDAAATVINPDDMRGLRGKDLPGSRKLLLGFSAVKTPTEDRTIAHFAITDLDPWRSASLTIGVANIDPGPPAGTLALHSFAGDGTVSTDEWGAGTLLTTFTGIDGGNQTLRIDISGLLAASVDAGDPYLSFRISTSSSDRFWLNATIGGTTRSMTGEGPTFIDLDVPQVPLPAGGLLILSGLGLLALWRRPR